MKTIIRVLSIFAIILALSSCATPLGRHYGNMGGLTGAAIGAAAGGVPGAIIGGASGAAVGGLYGDEQSRQWYEDQRDYYPDQGYQHGRNHRYNPPYRDDYDYYPNDRHGQGHGYVEPCARVYMPVYDRYGNIVGERLECQ